jgi:hypothetical protein
MANKRAIAAVVVLLAALVGSSSCGGESRGGDADGDAGPYEPPSGPVAEAEFMEQLPRAFCQALEPCCAEAGRPMNSRTCQQIVAALATDMQAPDTTYDPAVAQDCLTVLAAIRTCDESAIDDETCGRVYAGTVPLGGACESSSQCEPQADGETTCDFMREVCIVTQRGSDGDPCSATCESQGNGNRGNARPGRVHGHRVLARRRAVLLIGRVRSAGGSGRRLLERWPLRNRYLLRWDDPSLHGGGERRGSLRGCRLERRQLVRTGRLLHDRRGVCRTEGGRTTVRFFR